VAGVIRFYSAPVQCLFVTPDAIPYTNTFLDFRDTLNTCIIQVNGGVILVEKLYVLPRSLTHGHSTLCLCLRFEFTYAGHPPCIVQYMLTGDEI
jgi:hypothetical protein